MKVFLSWSGSLSRDIAECFYEWIPRVIQVVEPYLSSQDIEKGERWLSSVSSSLEDINFGIVFVTPTNLAAPWINFEAGSLSKRIDRSRLVPVLANVTDSDLVNHPLAQFQYVKLDKEDVARLFRGLNLSTNNPMSDVQFSETFEIWYSRFSKRLSEILAEQPAKEEKKEKVSTDQRVQRLEAAVDEVLNSQRRQTRTLDRLLQEFGPRRTSSSTAPVKNSLLKYVNTLADLRDADMLRWSSDTGQSVNELAEALRKDRDEGGSDPEDS